VRRADELIVAVEIPAVSGRQWFRKVGTRAAQAISKIVIAGVRNGDDVRVALGSVAPTVVGARRTQRAQASGGSVDGAMGVLRDEIAPIDDVRSTAEYRRLVSANLLRRFWTESQ
jgi:CO/xanthine dehydrogenase FAD-binding subunit